MATPTTQRAPEAPPPETGELSPVRPNSRRRLLVMAGLFVATLAALYFVLPKFAGLKQTWGRLSHGSPLWLAAACGVELLSIVGYAVLFRTVFGRDMRRLDWRASLQIPLAGIAAIRLVAAAGAGAVAVTVWALGRAGMEARIIACRMVANLLVQYAVYLFAVVLFGLALGLGILPGHRPFELTILPAILSIVARRRGGQRGARPRGRRAQAGARHPRPEVVAQPGRGVSRRRRRRWATAPAPRWRYCASARRGCSAPSRTGASTSPRSGAHSSPSAVARRSRC